MKELTDFSFLTAQPMAAAEKKTVALACPHDDHTQQVIVRALDEGIARFVLTTSKLTDDHLATIVESHPNDVEVVPCHDDADAASVAVETVRLHKADILMKGSLNTDVLLRAALDKERGILKRGKVMTHIAMAHISGYKKLLMFSDAAVIPHPSLEQFDAIVGYCADACHRLGIERPHIALTHFSEKTNSKFEHTIHYQEIIRRAEAGNYGDVLVAGPMDVKTAFDAESGQIKGVVSPVVGNVDVMIFPNIESGNTFYKTISLFAHATAAGWLAGTEVPVVVSSRADTVDSKFYSLAFACRLSNNPSSI
ncbi:MAG: phosphate acyltransferase [Prevotella sp.]